MEGSGWRDRLRSGRISVATEEEESEGSEGNLDSDQSLSTWSSLSEAHTDCKAQSHNAQCLLRPPRWVEVRRSDGARRADSRSIVAGRVHTNPCVEELPGIGPTVGMRDGASQSAAVTSRANCGIAPAAAAMTTRAPFLPMLLAALRLAACSFPEEPGPLLSAPAEVARHYPVFLGRAHRSYVRHESLYVQSVLRVNRTLYIGARDDLYRVELDHVSGDEMFYSKKRTWESNRNDIRICRMKGKHEEECRNYMKVLLSQPNGLFVCGTNALNPAVRQLHRMSVQSRVGNESRQCLEVRQKAGSERLAEFGNQDNWQTKGRLGTRHVSGNALQSVMRRRGFKQGALSRSGNGIQVCLISFRVSSMERHGRERRWTWQVLGQTRRNVLASTKYPQKIYSSSQRVTLIIFNFALKSSGRKKYSKIDRSHRERGARTSERACTFLCARHRPSARGVSIRSLMRPDHSCRCLLFPSIPGSAVCAFDMQQLARVFEGRFKEQKSPESIWTPVPDELVPRPRPGGCAGQGSRFSSSTAFPDEVLNFIKTHPLMDEAIPLLGYRPWIVKTMVRYQLNTMVVDTEAGPNKNRTVVFLGSTRGTVLKFLIMPGKESSYSSSNIFLEELEGYNPERCGDETAQARQPLSLTLDTPSHTLLMAFHSCVVRLPVARCHLHSRCMKNCISSRDPYCGWTRGSTCSLLRPGTRLPFVQDVEYGNTTHLGDCDGGQITKSTLVLARRSAEEPLEAGSVPEHREAPSSRVGDGLLRESFMDEPESLVTLNLLVVAAVSAFSTGAALSGLAVCWIMGQKHRQRSHSSASSSGSQRKGEKERVGPGPSGSGSVMSVSRHSAPERPRAQGETLFVMPNGWVKAGDLDPGLLPTPEQTPLQQKRPTPGLRLSDSGSSWDQSQTFLNPAGIQCPPPPAAIFLSSKLLQGAGDRRHEDSVDRQRYVSLYKYREQGVRSGTLLRKSAGDYNYPMTPQDSPDRRRVVSAPSTQMEYSGEALRWTHEAGYIYSGHGTTPTAGLHYGPAGAHPPGLSRSGLHGSRGLMDLAEFSHLLGKGGALPEIIRVRPLRSVERALLLLLLGNWVQHLTSDVYQEISAKRRTINPRDTHTHTHT
ncbi:hypothetical protein P4O66_014660 [Electrophorus voltai]|uniref:Sema domain-containing protein n=1 Tax=Electrophorus voltai TaxID=2609070 RepID=A0AAD9DS82_9TELE|nr:hypothetical protein P4O66_014660 [Electrophorus voltai]